MGGAVSSGWRPGAKAVVVAAIAGLAVVCLGYTIYRSLPHARVQVAPGTRTVTVETVQLSAAGGDAAARMEDMRDALATEIESRISSLPSSDAPRSRQSLREAAISAFEMYYAGRFEDYVASLARSGRAIPASLGAQTEEQRESFWRAKTHAIRGTTIDPSGVEVRARRVRGEVRFDDVPDGPLVERAISPEPSDVYEIVVPGELRDLAGKVHKGAFSIWLAYDERGGMWVVWKVGISGVPVKTPFALPPV